MSSDNGPALAAAPTLHPVRYGGVHTLTLPMGDRVRVRRPSLLTLVTSGLFPSDLATEVMKMARKGFAKAVESTDPEEYRRFAEMVDALIPHVLVDPAVGAVTDLSRDAEGRLTGIIELGALADVDKQHIFFFGQYVFRGDEELVDEIARRTQQQATPPGAPPEVTSQDVAPFREGAVRADAGPGGKTLQPAAVELGGIAG